jgi:hypothetical protein
MKIKANLNINISQKVIKKRILLKSLCLKPNNKVSKVKTSNSALTLNL